MQVYFVLFFIPGKTPSLMKYSSEGYLRYLTVVLGGRCKRVYYETFGVGGLLQLSYTSNGQGIRSLNYMCVVISMKSSWAWTRGSNQSLLPLSIFPRTGFALASSVLPAAPHMPSLQARVCPPVPPYPHMQFPQRLACHWTPCLIYLCSLVCVCI